MGLGRGVRIAILAEDRLSERFARRVLMDLGYERHELRFITDGRPDSGQGSAKQWVDLKYPAEVKTCRQKSHQKGIALLIGTDADEQTVDQRSRALTTALQKADLKPRGKDERIVHWIPRWSIETWGLALTGRNADEETPFKNTAQAKGIDWKAAASAFVEGYGMHVRGDPIDCLPSLLAAYHETERLELQPG